MMSFITSPMLAAKTAVKTPISATTVRAVSPPSAWNKGRKRATRKTPAATMVAAGVYLVARMFPLFELTPTVLLIVTSVGLFTFIFAGTLALVMTDIKRILAYSTVSHLGLMMLSLGAGAVGAAIFHLVAHGVSKALLFLGAGSVMHAMDDETDIWKMGGLRRRLPITSWTFVIGAASLAGVVPLAGFFSKDEILLHVLDGRLDFEALERLPDAEVTARLHPNCATMGSKKAPNPCQKAPEV